MEVFKKVKDYEEIFGQEKTKRDLSSALLMNRNLIIVGPPGIGKTTLARNVAKLLPEINANNCQYNCDPKEPLCPECKTNIQKTKKVKGEERFVRIQGSPDLSVEDLIGDIDPIKAMKFGPLSIEAFTPGKIFKANRGVLFFDEINRCPEKLQNALLQVLEEGKATIGSYSVDLPANFIFIGTMNPEDFSGTERLSEVFLDRFDLIYMDYPESLDIEKKIVRLKSFSLDEVKFPEELLNLVLNFIRRLRDEDSLERKPSVRASMGLYERAMSNALLSGRKKVEVKDVEEALVSVVAHRIRLKPSLRYITKPENFLENEFNKTLEEAKDNFSGKEDGSDFPWRS